MIPPINCTSKGLIPKTLTAASLTTAKASGNKSSRVSPLLNLSLNSVVLFCNSASVNSFIELSKPFIFSTNGITLFTSFSL